jgi:2-methylcitrate dehydratase
MDATIQRVAAYAASTDFASLPTAAVHACKRRLIDSVACAAGAYAEPFSEALRVFAGHYRGTPPARLWGSGAPTSMEMAGFVNGTLVRYLDFSDTWLAKGAGHPSDMIAALIAVAETRRSSGAELVAATLVAYEVYCSLAEAALERRTVDQATCAAVGAAAGAGRLLGCGEAQLGNALALALAPNLHLFNVRCGTLSDWKGCAGPNAARNGLFAALLASSGVTGPTAPVEGQGGLFEIVGRFEWQVGAGPRPLLMDTHLKLHPVCYHGQSAVDAALALRGAVGVDCIAEIEVETYAAAHRAMGQDPQCWTPATRETADHSLPYTVAVALQEGRLASEAYAPQRLSDPRTRSLMEKVRVLPSEAMTTAYPGRAQTRLTIRTSDGAVHTHQQDFARGHAANPISDEELEAKFRSLYSAWGDHNAAGRTLDALWAVDRLGNVADLVDVLCPFP